MNALSVDSMLSKGDFDLVRDVVYKHCGISLSEEKLALVRARITKQMRAGGFTSTKQYLNYVLKDRGSEAFTSFIDSISTNLTSFFRENPHFEFLSGTFLPALLEKKRSAGEKRLLGWSAACSSGEEPYSMAMTLLEATQATAASAEWDLRLLATDISTSVLATARAGLYSLARIAHVPQRLRKKYFSPTTNIAGEELYEVSPDLREIIRFRHLNLMAAWPFKGPFDFIFCRNVMIYFDKETQQKLVDRFWHCLQPGGLLFTGHSESLTGVVHRFTARKASIYEKVQS